MKIKDRCEDFLTTVYQTKLDAETLKESMDDIKKLGLGKITIKPVNRRIKVKSESLIENVVLTFYAMRLATDNIKLDLAKKNAKIGIESSKRQKKLV